MKWTTTTGGDGTRVAALDGGGRLPVPFEAVFSGDELEIVVSIDVADGRPICSEYRVRRLDGGGLELMTTEVMRNIKVRDLMAISCARVAMEQAPDGGVRWATALEAVEAAVGPIKRRKAPITDATLRKVAAAYKKRYRPGRMEEFARSEGYSERQMWRLVKLARERGFLPPSPNDKTRQLVPLPGDTAAAKRDPADVRARLLAHRERLQKGL